MDTLPPNALGRLLIFLERLDVERIHYRLNHVRETIMVEIAVPGERWEVEFFEDGEVEVERFVSEGKIEGENLLDRLFAEHGSTADVAPE